MQNPRCVSVQKKEMMQNRLSLTMMQKTWRWTFLRVIGSSVMDVPSAMHNSMDVDAKSIELVLNR